MEFDPNHHPRVLQFRWVYASMSRLNAIQLTIQLIKCIRFLVTVPWDAEAFARAVVAHRIPPDAPLSPALMDSKLMSQFPTPEYDPFEEPTTLVDCCGRILIWYLPGVLDDAANVSRKSVPLCIPCLKPPQDIVIDATKSIEGHLNPKNKSHGSSQWRNKNFKPGNALPYGCENFSPATC